jgi:hypothetical protein
MSPDPRRDFAVKRAVRDVRFADNTTPIVPMTLLHRRPDWRLDTSKTRGS